MITSTQSYTPYTHSTYVHYVGRVGKEDTSPILKTRGFTSTRGDIATSGLSHKGLFATAVLLTTPYSLSSPLKRGHFYAITCKLIASNTSTVDHLYYNENRAIDLGVFSGTVTDMLLKVIDKVTVTAHGFITHLHTLSNNTHTTPTILLTMKSNNKNPTTGAVVSWSTKHYLSPKWQDLLYIINYQVGAEIVSQGVLRDYNDANDMWECDAESVTVIRNSSNVFADTFPHAAVKTPVSIQKCNSRAPPAPSVDYSGLTLSYEGAELALHSPPSQDAMCPSFRNEMLRSGKRRRSEETQSH
ncbi:uncharacterized protein MELLADRAFT_69632 [Melampsora larici-populina 98AG31]|uniref:Uncharacterized protein n=1 Tax=Melampsora larici-populina (strain 98AG31 / pathotype 3-4-7) TaxID=747676 RepID=F4SBF8_MELLP|nr:uncharacterized protein MELLADRAFT_69632 [Melampsora larici-populina 98AG31]EGF98025.1 hypothetical protein MELLADRAFT_69632 [Melampsora larici-populina 98AG31]